VRVVAYDPAWPERFRQERKLLAAAIGPFLDGGIHHVGSTAVPELASKPTIDIMAGVPGLAESRACFAPLKAAGYIYAPYRPDEMHWFCKPDLVRRTHHLHLVPTGSRRFRATLAFRDHLRAHPSVAREYEALKRALAERFADDRDAYTAAKADFILDVAARELGERDARPRREASGPPPATAAS
jgi:GrpB-like predicted nucleotidyltransferase (UPF0157 family)